MCRVSGNDGKTNASLGLRKRNYLIIQNQVSSDEQLSNQRPIEIIQSDTNGVPRDAIPSPTEESRISDNDDAVDYTKELPTPKLFEAEVKRRFTNQPNKYILFLRTCSLYRNHRLDKNGMYNQLEKIFGKNRDLLNQFINFLPHKDQHKFRMRILTWCTLNNFTFEARIIFMQALKMRFLDQPGRYHAFIFLLKTRNIGLLSDQSFLQEALYSLFSHRDLLSQFRITFAPEKTFLQIRDILTSNRISTFGSSSRNSSTNGIRFHVKVMRTLDDEKYKAFCKFCKAFSNEDPDIYGTIDNIMPVFQGHPNLRREVIPFLPKNCQKLAWKKIQENVRASRRLRNLSITKSSR